MTIVEPQHDDYFNLVIYVRDLNVGDLNVIFHVPNGDVVEIDLETTNNYEQDDALN